MNEEKLRKIHTIYGIIMSALVVFLGICFIVSCVTIYLSGDRPFTRESIGTQLGSILMPILLCLIGIVGSVVISFYPLQNTRLKAKVDYGIALSRLRKRCDFDACPQDLKDKIKKQHILRIVAYAVLGVILVVCLTISLVYCTNEANFPADDINDEVARAVLVILCCTIASLASMLGTRAICSVSISKELEITKKVLGVSKKATSVEQKSDKKCKILINILRGVIVAIAIVFIVIGITNGGMADVLGKAIRICTECIGLG